MANHRHDSRHDRSSPRTRSQREREHRGRDLEGRDKRQSRDSAGEEKRKRRRPASGERPARNRKAEQEPARSPSEKHDTSNPESQRSSNALSIDSLAKLNALNAQSEYADGDRERRKTEKEKVAAGRVMKERGSHGRRRDEHRREKRRVVSGPLAEEGKVTRRRGGFVKSVSDQDDDGRKRRKKLCLAIGSLVLLLAILIPVGIVVSKKKASPPIEGKGAGGSNGGATQGDDPSNSNLHSVNENDIPTSAKGSVLDPFTWYDTTDFNVTFTAETVGGLPIMGLNSTWNDTTQANEYVPSLDKKWAYGTMPIRGINLGGWLSIEPFITPSLFNSYKENQGVVDEYTLTKELGPSQAAKLLEKHYARFMTEETFIQVQAAGFDHVRIPFSYWAVMTYPGDPYVPKISWRYLLRGIEYARKYGLRVNLDVHALPGSQNGWNHSGRQGAIGWLNGDDGALNGQRALDLHTQLSQFFSQPRYKNVIAIYGLVNEPRMAALSVDDVITWTTSAVGIVRKNGIQQMIAFGDGFLGLQKWQGKLQGIQGLMLDAHQYVIFNPDQIKFTHQKKVQYACSGWSSQMKQSLDTSSG